MAPSEGLARRIAAWGSTSPAPQVLFEACRAGRARSWLPSDLQREMGEGLHRVDACDHCEATAVLGRSPGGWGAPLGLDGSELPGCGA